MLTKDGSDCDKCAKALQHSVLLKQCTEAQLKHICSKYAVKKKYNKGDIIQREGEPQQNMYILAEGSVYREKVDEHGDLHHIDTHMGGHTVGSLHVMHKDPAYATTKCASDVETYVIDGEKLISYFRSDPDFSYNVCYGLMQEVRKWTRAQRTPLLEQHAKKTPFLAVSAAAGIESFYRAALNAFLNQQLTGVKMGALFPNMHIQIPVRMAYINGIKGSRQYIDETLGEERSTPVRLGAAVAPGLLMTPLSSILEASNAGHSNPEAIWKRWTRGLVPRMGREVIFGVGLNQLSDYCEERVPPFIQGTLLRNAAGSLVAGVISGYLSHVVHNMSTLKLMNPNKSYKQHMQEFIAKSEKRLPPGFATGYSKTVISTATAILFPLGVGLRTTQIVGSFIILNGTISVISRYLYTKPS